MAVWMTQLAVPNVTHTDSNSLTENIFHYFLSRVCNKGGKKLIHIGTREGICLHCPVRLHVL